MASLDEVRDDYTDENLPVLLLLGLVSSLQRMEPLLPPRPEPTESPPSAAAPGTEPGPSRFLCLVLGLIAFRDRVMSTLMPLRGAPKASGASGQPDAPEATLAHLRDSAKPTVLHGAPDDSEAERAPSLRELLR
ncbi:hypothetical protein ACLESO_32935 [Pyxidicoccus sp. 3LG]